MSYSRSRHYWVQAAVVLPLLVQGIWAFAQVPVEEIGSTPRTGEPASKSYSVKASSDQETYYQLQLLRDEVRTLRGMLEEQDNHLAQIKRKQRDDYIDLDRRLAVITAGGLRPSDSGGAGMANDAVAIRPQNSSAIAGPGPNGLGAISSEDVAQKAVYDQAYALLKARKIDEAMIALIKYNETYPNGIYAANAQYWLGEVYLLKNDLPEATAAFRSVIAQHSDHRKVDDAKYKLGKIYHLQNQPEQAKELLLSVSKGSGSAAKLAQDYLSLHF